ncbi:MAG: DUF3696 domain-containing protein [Lachnospiraceae bacterium]|nr:DUF3696 domain-containing protein [Lachnospiraceae bacterium]
MLKGIHIKNFKCFEKLDISLRNINVLTGINGMGKSTVIQSLLLLRQSFDRERGIRGLSLNGEYVRLGTAQDVLYEKAVDETVGFGIDSDLGNMSFQFRYIPDSDYLPVDRADTGSPAFELWGNSFAYLSAYRIEPLELYRITNEENVNRREFGTNGEFAIQYLGIHGDDKVINSNVVINDKLGDSLGNQTRIWMDRIAPGVSPKVLLNLQNRTSELRYEFIEGKEKTNSYKSINVGFGITYVLPLIVSLLAAKTGDLIMIENPEAHIHPAGQRMLGELIARAGAGGVQLLVETHSDHIMNGIRLAVKRNQIEGEKVNVFYFYKDCNDEYRHKYVKPEIYPDGRLSCWPEGFFDEWDKALYELI